MATVARELVLASEDGGRCEALEWGDGDRGVALVPGRLFTRESWSELAERLAVAGWRCVAVDPRGQGGSTAGSAGDRGAAGDVRAAVAHLRRHCRQVALIGASLGGALALESTVAPGDGRADALVVLSPASMHRADRVPVPVLFVCSEGEKLRSWVEALSRECGDGATLERVDGDGHGHALLDGDAGAVLERRLVDYLEAALATPTGD